MSDLREIFDDFEVIFGRVEFGRVTPPTNPLAAAGAPALSPSALAAAPIEQESL